MRRRLVLLLSGCVATLLLITGSLYAASYAGVFTFVQSPVPIATASAVNGNSQPAIDFSNYSSVGNQTMSLRYNSKGTCNTTRDREEDVRASVASGGTSPTITVTFPGPTNVTYPLSNVHFHTHAEHKFNGTYEPIEAHLVHFNASAGAGRPQYVVVTVYLRPAAGWSEYDELLFNTPAECDPAVNRLDINPANLLPTSTTTSYRYEGSLTTGSSSPYPGPVAWVIFDPSVGRTLQSSHITAYENVFSGVGGNWRAEQSPTTIYKKPW
ncbi:carbonic anhydrase family protein [Rhizohabitans arisaemae]|uniref:carbonic anhydrase family protein n=1 Tax=Rhizohabitans arisaemae TaxID=2720610 RepID=UPI0024B080B1|nr:carbonic anhydrase family protein [Rhizohabitans arisaemae]